MLGAGLVARPLIRYLLEVGGFDVTVASRTVEKAVQLVEGHPKGDPLAFDISYEMDLLGLVSDHEVVISLLPYTHHPAVARACLEEGKHMITTSYVSPAMREMDARAKDAGLLFLNEIGLDPGIDHMEAMSIIDELKSKDVRVQEFVSYCGGLPSPEHNTNPWGYKFSWSPRGVVLASRNSARFRKDGRDIEVPGRELFGSYVHVPIAGLGEFEGYPNRDSVPYAATYGIPEARTVLRGTLRNKGWCDTWKGLHDIGMLDDSPANAKTYRGLLEGLAPGPGDIRGRALKLLRTRDNWRVLSNWEWLGLLSDIPIIEGSSRIDALSVLLETKLNYAPGERDMIVLEHRFGTSGSEGKSTIRSTLIAKGIPDGDSAMSRTVGLPAALAAEMVLKGELKGLSGVMIPSVPAIYGPVLERLAKMGLSFRRSWT
ncbi:MAG: saccharopine dehydrogenase NADP-binding domain-containing protein [Candidatus Thermoplasmatota archaeon]|nr:saccharopine dehydrogenase NADP-binding domain-containing protein [Candidatus Thermoplasmatota archaeon]